MDLFDLARVVWGRRYVVVPIGLLTLGLALYVHASVPPELEASGFLQWDLPQYDAARAPGSNRLDPAALALGIELSGDVSYSVGPLEGPFFVISTAASSAQEARTAVNEVMAELESRISAIQEAEGVPESRRTDLRTVVPDAVLETQPDDTVIATAQMFLYDPVADVENPYRPDASTARLLQVGASSDAGRERFEQLAGPDLDFEISQEARDSASLVGIAVVGSDEAKVLGAFDVVVDLLNEDLDARQTRAGVAPNQRIALRVLDAPLTVEEIGPPVGRATIGIIGLGGLLALGAAFGSEALWTTTRTRSDSSSPKPSTGDDQRADN